VGTLSLGSPATMSFRKKMSKSERVGLPGGSRKAHLTFKLEHGDIVLMHGTAIHKFYEVCLPMVAVMNWETVADE
jgi:alkylated DNA repair dioxygenase AlkB